MTIDRARTNFEGNERIDIPDFKGMLDNAFDDFRHLIQLLIDDGARRVLKRYTQGTHVGLSFKIALDKERGFYDLNQEWVVKTADASGTVASLALTPNTTNYVEVRVNQFTDNAQPRAFWDVDIGLTGEEFFDTINVRKRVEEGFQSNTTGFTPGAVPLFLVVTGSSTITSVSPVPQDLLWQPRAFALPAATSRASVYDGVQDLRSFIDFLGAAVGEMKGTSQLLESAPWSSLKLLREYQGLMITSTPIVTFEGTFGTDKLNLSADLKFDIAGRTGGQYSLLAATFTLLDGQALYVTIPETAPPATLTATIVNIGAVPIDPTASGSSPRIFVLFMRRGTTVFGSMDLSPLESGESDTVGRDLSVALRTRLGLLTDTTYQAYTSTHVIASGDTYPEALSKIDNELYAIQSNEPKEAFWTASGSQTVFDITVGASLSNGTFLWSTNNAQADIIVTVDGRIETQDYTGGTGQNYRKITTGQIQFNTPPKAGSRVKVRREGTSYGGAVAPTSGGWETPVDHDILPPDLAYNVGGPTQRFLNGYFETLRVNNIVIETGIGEIEAVKTKVNGAAGTIVAGKVVSLFSDGMIYPAEADTSQGKRFVGIAAENILSGASGRVALFGPNVPGVLASMGFAPGDEIFIDNLGNYSNGPNLDSTSDYQRVGWADCADGTGTGTVTDLIASYQRNDKVKPEEDFILTVTGQTDYALPTLVLDPSNAVLDAQLWYDGVYQQLDPSGARGFKKLTSTSIRLSEAPSIDGKEIVVRKEGLIVAPDSGGGSADFSNIPIQPTPNSAGAGNLDLGTLARPWSGLVVKDDVTNQVWRISIVSGVFDMVFLGTYP